MKVLLLILTVSFITGCSDRTREHYTNTKCPCVVTDISKIEDSYEITVKGVSPWEPGVYYHFTYYTQIKRQIGDTIQ